VSRVSGWAPGRKTRAAWKERAARGAGAGRHARRRARRRARRPRGGGARWVRATRTMARYAVQRPRAWPARFSSRAEACEAQGCAANQVAAERGFYSLGRRGAGRLVLGVVEPRGRPQARVWMFERAVGSRTAGKQLAIARAPRARASPGARRANRKLTVPKPGLTMRRLASSRPRLKISARASRPRLRTPGRQVG
jgi:hypothetical protein